jgi:hypothetical protein
MQKNVVTRRRRRRRSQGRTILGDGSYTYSLKNGTGLIPISKVKDKILRTLLYRGYSRM